MSGLHGSITSRHLGEDPRAWLQARKVRLTPESNALRVPRSSCGYGESAPVAYVRRRGSDVYLLRYLTYDTEADGSYLFVFDKLLFALPPGRYAVEIWQGDMPSLHDCSTGRICGQFEVEIDGPCTVDVNLIEALESRRPHIRKGNLDVSNPIFDPIKDFSAQTCAVLGRTDTAIPLKTADKAALCAMVLCRAVELRLCDGVRVETVRFNGCTADGEPEFVRAIDGEGPYRFPKGSTLTFDWTENNITAACEGC